jgi:hypothetical protein
MCIRKNWNFFNKCFWENWISACRKLKRDPCLSPCKNIKSNWIEDLNIRPETLKPVQEKSRHIVKLIGIVNGFLKRTQMAQQLRERIEKWHYMKLKSFCTTKLKRLLTEWEKIIASHTSDKGLITRIYAKLKKLNSPKITDPMKNWANDLSRAFSKEEVQMSKNHLKKCSPSLAIKEMQIKITLRFHLIPVRMTTNNNKCWQECGEKGTLIHYWWECKLVQSL